MSLNIDPSKLAFTFVEGVHNGRVTIALYAFNESGNLIVTGNQTADLKLKDADYKAILTKGIPYAVTSGSTRRAAGPRRRLRFQGRLDRQLRPVREIGRVFRPANLWTLT